MFDQREKVVHDTTKYSWLRTAKSSSTNKVSSMQGDVWQFFVKQKQKIENLIDLGDLRGVVAHLKNLNERFVGQVNILTRKHKDVFGNKAGVSRINRLDFLLHAAQQGIQIVQRQEVVEYGGAHHDLSRRVKIIFNLYAKMLQILQKQSSLLFSATSLQQQTSTFLVVGNGTEGEMASDESTFKELLKAQDLNLIIENAKGCLDAFCEKSKLLEIVKKSFEDFNMSKSEIMLLESACLTEVIRRFLFANNLKASADCLQKCFFKSVKQESTASRARFLKTLTEMAQDVASELDAKDKASLVKAQVYILEDHYKKEPDTINFYSLDSMCLVFVKMSKLYQLMKTYSLFEVKNKESKNFDIFELYSLMLAQYIEYFNVNNMIYKRFLHIVQSKSENSKNVELENKKRLRLTAKAITELLSYAKFVNERLNMNVILKNAQLSTMAANLNDRLGCAKNAYEKLATVRSFDRQTQQLCLDEASSTAIALSDVV